jgi:hypothetical protein
MKIFLKVIRKIMNEDMRKLRMKSKRNVQGMNQKMKIHIVGGRVILSAPNAEDWNRVHNSRKKSHPALAERK